MSKIQLNNIKGEPHNIVIYLFKKIDNNISNLSTNIESKIDNINFLIKSQNKHEFVRKITFNKGLIRIYLKKGYRIEGEKIKKDILNKIQSLKKLITTLTKLINTLQSIQKTIRTLIVAYSIIEKLLLINPVTKKLFKTIKKSFTVLFTRAILNDINELVKVSINDNLKNLENNIIKKIKNFKIELLEDNEDVFKLPQLINNDKTNILETDVKDLNLSSVKDLNLSSNFEDYESLNGLKFKLTVEKYNNSKKLIGKAITNPGGQILFETAPSSIYNKDELILELKSIIELQEGGTKSYNKI